MADAKMLKKVPVREQDPKAVSYTHLDVYKRQRRYLCG